MGHTGYYQKFIWNYASITTPIKKLLKKVESFTWLENYQEEINILKEKLVSAPILVYPDWNKKFHVHIDASEISLGVVLAQPGEGNLDHLSYFSNRKFLNVEKNYTKTEREALTMVYSLQNFRHYLLGGLFNFFMDNSELRYLVNNRS